MSCNVFTLPIKIYVQLFTPEENDHSYPSLFVFPHTSNFGFSFILIYFFRKNSVVHESDGHRAKEGIFTVTHVSLVSKYQCRQGSFETLFLNIYTHHTEYAVNTIVLYRCTYKGLGSNGYPIVKQPMVSIDVISYKAYLVEGNNKVSITVERAYIFPPLWLRILKDAACIDTSLAPLLDVPTSN